MLLDSCIEVAQTAIVALDSNDACSVLACVRASALHVLRSDQVPLEPGIKANLVIDDLQRDSVGRGMRCKSVSKLVLPLFPSPLRPHTHCSSIANVLLVVHANMTSLSQQLECSEGRLGYAVDVNQSESAMEADVVSWEALLLKHLHYSRGR